MPNKYYYTRVLIMLSAFFLVAVSGNAVNILHFEEDNSAWCGAPISDDEQDRRGWQESPTDSDFLFEIPGSYENAGDAALRLRFFPSAYPSHIRLLVNGKSIGTAAKRIGATDLEFRCPKAILNAGRDNVLEIEQFYPNEKGEIIELGGEGFDSFDVAFGAPVKDFTWPIEDFNNHDNRNSLTTLRSGGNAGSDSGKDGITENEGDYLILTGDAFVSALQPLVNLRAGEGFTVRVVTLSQICDWYQAYPGDEAIAVRQFLNYAWAHWALKPKYVLLVGTWADNYPSYQTFPFHYYMDPYTFSYVQSDIWFSQTEDGYLDFSPKFALGRIPAVTAEEVSDYIAKVVYYENHLNPAWKNDVDVIGNDVDTWTGSYEGIPEEAYLAWVALIQDYTSEIYTTIDQTYNPLKILASDYENKPQRWLAFKNSLDAGKSVAYFIGFADHLRMGQFLNDEGTGATRDLTNAGKYPIFFGNGCTINDMEVGNSGQPDCLCSDLVLAPDKATVAAVGSSRVSNPRHFIDYLTSTADYLSHSGYERVGDIHKNALIYAMNLGEFGRSPHPWYYNSLQLVGDPAVHVLGDRGGLPFLLGGWPKRTHEATDSVAVADITPVLGNQQPADSGENSGSGTDDPLYGYTTLDVVARGHGDVYVWGAEGNQHYRSGGIFGNNTPPIVADIDNNGILDTVCLSDALHAIWVFDKYGAQLEGFPASIPGITSYSPAVGDVNGDGYLEILCVGGSSCNELFAFDHNGEILPGWPKNAGGAYLWGSPSVGDVDNDGELEVVITTGNKLYAFSDDTTGVEDTLTFGSLINASRAVLADLDSDPDLEIVVGCEKIAADGGTDYEIPNLFILNRVNGVYTVQSQYSTVGDKGILFPPCVGDFRPQHEGKEIITLVTGWSQQEGYLDCWTTTGGTLTCISHRSLGVNITPTSAPTVADVIKDPPPNNGYEVLFGTPGKLSCYRAFYDMSEAPNWDGGLTGDVTTPLVTDLNADGKTDIVCSDYEAVYAFTTGNPYDGLENFDWVRDGHDNLNMGLWDIAAPTGLAAIDNPDDQGGKITLTWVRSVDDGVRSTRVTEYKIYGFVDQGLPPSLDGGDTTNPALARKLAEGKRAALMRGEAFAEPTLFTGPSNETSPDIGVTPPANSVGGGTDSTFGLLATIPAGTYTYEHTGLTNGYRYQYYIVATDGTRDAQKSVTVEVTPHDNIAPAPPTTFAGVYNEMDINVHLTWDLSADDPYHEEGQPGDAIAGSPAGPGALSPFPNRAGAPYGGNRGGAAASSGLDTAAYAGLPTDLAPSALGTVAGFGDEAAGMSDRQKEFLKKKIASALPGAPKGYYAPPPQGFPNYGRDGGANDVVQYRITKSVNGGGSVVSFFVTCGTTEFYDYDVSLGNLYGYTICAIDSENESSEAGPVVIDLRSGGEGDAGGPITAAPMDPLGAAFPDDPRRASDPGSIAAGGFLEGGARPTSIITCRPNPIKGTATFQINVRKATRATLSVFDVSGRKVATVYDGPVPAGGMSATWAADVPNGIYLYTLETEEKRYSGKTAVLR